MKRIHGIPINNAKAYGHIVRTLHRKNAQIETWVIA